MSNLLFVYGSLMPSSTARFGLEQRRRLARESRLVGPATWRGDLYDLGSYPGAVEGDGVIHGELLELVDPETSFRWLDPYEGINPAVAGGVGDYTRVIRDVEAGRDMQSAWIYLWAKPLNGATPLPDGRWRGVP